MTHYPELKRITVLGCGDEESFLFVDTPRRGEVVNLFYPNGDLFRCRVELVEWCGSPNVEDYGYPEVTIQVSRI